MSKQQVSERRFIFLSLTPIVLLFLVFSVIPIGIGTVLMLFDYSPLSSSVPFAGLKHIRELLSDEMFYKSLRVTFTFVAVAIPANIAFTLLIAIGINKIRGRFWKNSFRTMFFLPAIAPLAGSAVIWTTMFNADSGVVNMALGMLGLPSVDWLTDPSTALLSIIIMTLWADVGYNIVLFMAGLDSIPESLYEAAELDGASPWHVFWSITLPMLSRTMLFVFIMTSISYFQMFPQFQIMTKGGPLYETYVLALNIYDQAFTYMNMSYASAMAFVMLIIILVLTLIQMRIGRSQWEH
ncbi:MULTISPECIES: carbohydrate ABC transporter permease [Cohnella]|uniref:Multiple sugar transport system permease protein/sn-glycerol 3-phosphate transport system permease protein/raffinose/stachyose/melibiose transport system permease protein n=1 Tax=Cohnella phaseoli TaxID=456490 RepID=A0A3D9KCF0_9BACL|nr:sugar ABC transporter permease [Cohnella phaseoli]RED84211.1 multiple sugar transport system permease protein/sn-glycerol 3-phosphate transport system permease protein/raffinose/stachyose/melibiose transport system permease protein [Cohnella phaseoli]